MKTATAAWLAMLFSMGALLAGEELQRVHPKGSAEMIDKLDVAEIEKIELLKLDWFRNEIREGDASLTRRVYAEAPLLPGKEKREVATALLTLIKDAPAYAQPKRGEPEASDAVMVVHPKGGEAFEVWYNAGLKAPFAGRYSLELKEALWSLSHSDSSVAIIQIKDGKVKRTIHENPLIPPHRGGVASGTLRTELRLTRAKGLTLYVKLTAKDDFPKPLADRRVEMEDEQPVHYGESTVYKSGEDTYVVMVEQGAKR